MGVCCSKKDVKATESIPKYQIEEDQPHQQNEVSIRALNDEDLEQSLSQVNKYTTKFSLEAIQISDNGAEHLSQVLRLMEQPTHISIDFDKSCTITDDALKLLSFSLQTQFVTRLQSLSFRIEWSNLITAKGIERLQPMFKYTKFLTELDLQFGGQQFGDGTFDAIAGILKLEEMRGLNKLNLRFDRFEVLENESAKELASSFQYLGYLNSLSLAFNQCTGIQSSSIEILGKLLPSMANLSFLSMRFPYCSEMDNPEVLDNYIKSIHSLNSLKELVLDFSGCPMINNESIIRSFLVFQHLQKFVGLFENIVYLSGQDLLALSKWLDPEDHDNVTLYVGTQTTITSQSLKEFASRLNNLYRLKSFNVEVQHEVKVSSIKIYEKLAEGFSAKFLNSLTSLSTHNPQIINRNSFVTNLNPSFISNVNVSSNNSSIIKQDKEKIRTENHNPFIKKLLTIRQSKYNLPLECNNILVFNGNARIATLDSINLNIQANQSLEAIYLDLNNSKEIKEDEIKELSKHLVKARNLVYLKLDLAHCPGFTIQSFEDMFLSISNLKELRSLTLSAEGCTGISNQSLQRISSCLKNLTKLQSLDLNLSPEYDSIKINMSRGLEGIIQPLSEMPLLREVSFDISGQALNNSVFEMFQNILKQRDITNFQLNIKECISFSTKAFNELISSLKPLSTLHLGLDSCTQINDTSLETLANFISANPNTLEDFLIDLSFCQQITDKGVMTLANAIKTQSSKLRILQFGITSSKKLTAESEIALYQAVQACNHLTSLIPEVDYPPKDARSLKVFSNALQSIKSLKRLEIKCSLSGIDKSQMEIFSDGLQSLKNLRLFKLDLVGCVNIDNDALSTITTFIEPMAKLDHLVLNLAGCINISDLGVQEVVDAVTHSKAPLTKITLNLSQTQITDFGLRALSSALRKKNTLGCLSLKADNCENIDQHDTKALINDELKQILDQSLEDDKVVIIDGDPLDDM